jgi:Small metal-binding protein
MILKPIVCALVAGMLGLFGAGIAYAGEHETHAAEAIKHAEAAANEGQKGSAAAVAEHAQEALKHAEMAQKVKADPHVAEAEKALKEAVEHGNMGHADVAGKAAENAVSHLKMAYKGKEITKEKKTIKEKEPY